MSSFGKRKFLVSPAKNSEHWRKITKALQENLCQNKTNDNHAANVYKAILTYRGDYKPTYTNIINLQKAMQQYRPKINYSQLLSSLVQHCVALEDQKHLDQINLLYSGQSNIVGISDKDCLILLANAFFCTFYERDKHADFNDYPPFSFIRLFKEEQKGNSVEDVKVEKIKCILSYFDTMINDGSHNSGKSRNIKFERVRNPNRIDWASSRSPLIPIEFSKSPIEESNCDLHVDFANKKVGGGVLGNGSVQEEVLFITCPELIVASLLTEELDDNEVLFMSNFETFSRFSGYARTFKYSGPQTTNTINKNVVAMDALQFRSYEEKDQYKPENIKRELHKCQVAFQNPEHKTIATGNWGCGAFGGDPQLKTVIQWLAASVHNKKVTFHMIHDNVRQDLKKLSNEMQTRKITVGLLYQSLLSYDPYKGRNSLLQYLITKAGRPKHEWHSSHKGYSQQSGSHNQSRYKSANHNSSNSHGNNQRQHRVGSSGFTHNKSNHTGHEAKTRNSDSPPKETAGLVETVLNQVGKVAQYVSETFLSVSVKEIKQNFESNGTNHQSKSSNQKHTNDSSNMHGIMGTSSASQHE